MRRDTGVFLATASAAVSIVYFSVTAHDLPLATLYTSAGFSVLGFASALYLIPLLGPTFVERDLKGRDRLKRSGPDIPESMGLICASIYILLLILFIPFLFSDAVHPRSKQHHTSHLPPLVQSDFPHQQLAIYLSALLSLLSATLLGFLDDVFDIRWRHKLPIPLVASIPLLLVYFAENGSTSVVLPRFMRDVAGRTILELGTWYYLYMAMLSTFCTNSINILAGINGIEASQALVIAVSIAINDMLYLPFTFDANFRWFHIGGVYGAGMAWGSKEMVDRHLLSLYFMLPLIGVCAGFLCHNWFPAKVFPGDALCYVTGMAFAVVGILGHFSKTLLLFFIPQVFNFILSCPQLFTLVPCPRHRMPVPVINKEGDVVLISASTFSYERPASTLATCILVCLEKLRMVRLTRNKRTTEIVGGTNLTLLNAWLTIRGPMPEAQLASECIGLQIAGTLLAFFIRYGLAGLFYTLEDDRR